MKQTSRLDPVWNKMTEEERVTYTCMRLLGIHQRDENGNITVFMSSRTFDEITKYEDEILEKYDKHI